MIRSPLMTIMTDAVMKASRSLKRDFGEVENLQVSRKGPGDFVSAADRKAEEILREALEKARPGYGFVMEESGDRRGQRQEPSLAHRPPRRHHQLPARPAAVRDLGRPRAGGAGRRRRHLRPGQGRAVHRREGPGRLSQQPPHPRRGAHRAWRRRSWSAAFRMSGKGDHAPVPREVGGRDGPGRAAAPPRVGGARPRLRGERAGSMPTGNAGSIPGTSRRASC